MKPCSILPIIQGFIDKSDLETILKTCNKTDKPPKPSKKLVTIIFIDIFFKLIHEIKLIPFVISKIPVNREFINCDRMLNLVQIGVKTKFIIFIILLEFKIEMITENKITNPPIIKIVFIADLMLFPSISPRFENDIFCNLFSEVDVL